jgi:hypothetical protein
MVLVWRGVAPGAETAVAAAERGGRGVRRGDAAAPQPLSGRRACHAAPLLVCECLPTTLIDPHSRIYPTNHSIISEEINKNYYHGVQPA